MSAKQSVFIVYIDHGYEGCSPPQRAFATEELANLFIAGMRLAGGVHPEVSMLEIDRPEDFEPEGQEKTE